MIENPLSLPKRNPALTIKHIGLLFLYSIVCYTNGFAKHKHITPKLSIYFKTSDCVKCYFPLTYINEASKRMKVECVVHSDDKDYIQELLHKYQVKPGTYTMRDMTVKEKSLYTQAASTYIFESDAGSLFGDYNVLYYIKEHLEDLLAQKPLQAKIINSSYGGIPIMQPFAMVGNKSVIYDEKLEKLYFDTPEGNMIVPTLSYFKPDSTLNIFKIDSSYKKRYMNSVPDPRFSNTHAQIQYISSWKKTPVLAGTLTICPTPLYRTQRNKFLIFYTDTVISHKQYTYIDNSSKLVCGLSEGMSFDKNTPVLDSFYSIVWQRKRKPDSFFVGHYTYHFSDTTWHQDRSYILDTPRPGFCYDQNEEYIAGQYVVNSDLPILYQYMPDIHHIDLSYMLSYMLQKPIPDNVALPKGINVGKIWHEGKVVKMFCGSKDEGLYCVSYITDMGIYQIHRLQLPFPLSKFRDMAYNEAGTPVILFQNGKNHEVWKFE